MKNIISQITMKDLEQTIFRSLQKSFSEAMANILLEIDAVIAGGNQRVLPLTLLLEIEITELS